MNQQVTTNIDDKTLAIVTNRLQEVGLNLVTTLAAHSLGSEIGREDLRFAGGTVLLLGNAGQGFWQQLRQNWPDGADPVDKYSAQQSEKILNDCLPGVSRRLLFPVHDCAIYLQRLMSAAGWHTPSPLGIGMHCQYGLWSACRAVWWLDANVGPAQSASQRTDHCASCLSKACVSSCPAGALRDGAAPNLTRCADYRVSHASSCAGTCVAREACPVAVNHRYTPEQLNYHYELARSAIVRYRSDAGTENGE